MGMTLPAICENPGCGAIFLAISPVTSTLNNSGGVLRLGGCPRCNSYGVVPHGKYQAVKGSTVFTPLSDDDRAFLSRALWIAADAVRDGLSPEQAAAKMPELSALWRLMPSNQQEAVQFWMLVLAVIGAMLMAYQTLSGSAPAEIHLPKDVVDAIQSARPGTRGDSHTEPPQ